MSKPQHYAPAIDQRQADAISAGCADAHKKAGCVGMDTARFSYLSVG